MKNPGRDFGRSGRWIAPILAGAMLAGMALLVGCYHPHYYGHPGGGYYGYGHHDRHDRDRDHDRHERRWERRHRGDRHR